MSALAITVIAVVAIASGYYVGVSNPRLTTTTEFTASTTTTKSTTSETTSCPPLVGCVPIDVPVILNAFVTQTSAKDNCSIATEEYAVCDVALFAGVQGSVVLNMTSQNGDSYVAFGTYSSQDQYVQFTSTYPCLYSSSPPDYNTARCPISSTGTVYRFNYTVSQNLLAQTEAVLTIVVTKTCCYP